MTTFFPMKLTCPNCAKEFSVQILGSTNNFGGRTTDFRPIAAGSQPITAYLHTCPRCGFTGGRRRYGEPVGPRLAAFIAERITPLVRDEQPVAWRRFEFAAWIEREQDGDPEQIADYYLHAAWCCEDDGVAEVEENNQYYRRQAIEYFERALEHGKVAAENTGVVTYLIGELYRRVGEPETAAVWYDKAIELSRSMGQEQIAELAGRQKTDPQERMER